MKTANNYIAETAANMERAVHRMQPSLHIVPVKVPLPTTPEMITRYIENLLNDQEQRICDLADE